VMAANVYIKQNRVDLFATCRNGKRVPDCSYCKTFFHQLLPITNCAGKDCKLSYDKGKMKCVRKGPTCGDRGDRCRKIASLPSISTCCPGFSCRKNKCVERKVCYDHRAGKNAKCPGGWFCDGLMGMCRKCSSEYVIRVPDSCKPYGSIKVPYKAGPHRQPCTNKNDCRGTKRTYCCPDKFCGTMQECGITK